MWTEPEHLSRWLPPPGSTMNFIRADIRPRGIGFFSVSDEKGESMYGRVHFQEIEQPEKILYTQQFFGAQKELVRAPMVSG